MVFGQMVEGLAPAKAQHLVTSFLSGTKTACGITTDSTRRYQHVETTKHAKMVTCKRCLKELGQ
jgi:hypothetical protein